jgi:hypothetical protein
MRTYAILFVAGLAILGFAAPASAEDTEQSEGTVVDRPEHPLEVPLNLTHDELVRDYPTIARALAQPGTFTAVRTSELESFQAFWERMFDYDGIRVDGVDWIVMPAIAGPVDPINAHEGGPAQGGQASGLAVLGVLGAAAAAVLAYRRT